MKNKLFKKVLCFILSVCLLLSALGVTALAAEGEDESLKKPQEGENYPYSVPSLEEMQDLVGTSTYEEYLKNFGALGKDGLSVIPVDVVNFVAGGAGELVANSEICQTAMKENPQNWITFGDNQNTSVYLPAKGEVTWNVTLTKEQAGLYFIKIEYYNCITEESSISSIERNFRIDGKVPFDEIGTIKFNKNWQYDNITVDTFEAVGEADSFNTEYTRDDNGYYKIVTNVSGGVKTVTTYTMSQDINGNSMAPGVDALANWNTYYLQDSTGYYTGYFNFYMADGTRSLTLEAERDPMIIKSIELVPVDDRTDIPTYSEILAQYEEMGLKPAVNGEIVEIQAEFPDIVSDSSVAASNDNTSAVTSPVEAGAQLYNVIGETSYDAVGQWAAYKFRVSETGLYNLSMRYKQSALQGMYVCRTIKLSGGKYGLADGTPTVPFMEAYNTQYNYSKEWQSTFLSDGVNDPFLFYFEEGVEYTVYFECSLGTLKNYIQRVENALNEINAAYLSILQLTGTEPDEYRDYNFIGIMPQVLVTFLEEAIELMDVKAGLEELCGTNGSHIATLETVAIVLNTMGSDKGDNVAANMSTLKSYLGTLGTWINNSKRSSIMVDSISVVPADEDGGKAVANEDKLARGKAGFFRSVWFEIQSFFYSFFTEYDQMGLTSIPDEDTPQIDVWLATGRDQSQIWRTMIDAHGSYTDSTGTAVALKLVTGGTLLPSILSGKGPDVYLGLGSADVINYAIRDAIVGVSGNDTKGLTEEENKVFTTTYYSYKNADGTVETTSEYRGEENLSFVSNPFNNVIEGNFADAAMDTLTLLDVSYGVPQTMGFAMMFYRMDVLAKLGLEVPESWHELLSILPALQTNNMSMGVAYISALDFMIYQKGGSMWKYTDESLYDSKYAGAKVDIDSNVALEAFDFVCRLYSDYSFPVSYDTANRFRTGEMPIVIGDYASIYNSLTVYATEIEGL